MKKISYTKWLMSIVLMVSLHAHGIPADSTTEKINKLMSSLYERGQFTGSVLVARAGQVVYRGAFGKSNVEANQPYTPETPSNIASVTKQFTATVIMMLAEQKKLTYDDPVFKFIPEMPVGTTAVTIRHLLTHTSGIPEYSNISGVDRPGATNDDIVKALSKQNLQFAPGTRYRYSNSGYVLLAIIAERITGKSFNDYLQEKIFTPLGMSSTFTFKGADKLPKGTAHAYNQFGKPDDFNSLIEGASGIYSTVDDLLKWDQALYTEKLVSQAALTEAFTPYPVKEGKSNYGFGWNSAGSSDDPYVWHTGNTGGYRAYIQRRLKSRITIILLTNKGSTKRQEMSDVIVNIMNGNPYSLPKLSLTNKMYSIVKQYGAARAFKFYDSLKTSKDTSYDWGEQELNTLGYQLLYPENLVDDAIRVFTLNTQDYPASSNAFDSLAEAYNKKGDKAHAIEYYQKAIRLDPDNLGSVNALKKLQQ